MKRTNDVCKSYTIHAGLSELTVSETPERLAIKVTVTVDGIAKSVELTRLQFRTLCEMNSSYDGLEVEDAPEEVELEEAGHDVVPA